MASGSIEPLTASPFGLLDAHSSLRLVTDRGESTQENH
jgi:hypothetical protein